MTRRIGEVLAFGLAATLALGTTVPVSAHGITERLSVEPRGVQGNRFSYGAVANKTNLTYDVFVRHRQLGVTERVSLGSGGAQGDRDRNGVTLSADEGFVAFHSAAIDLVRGDTNFIADVFVRERQMGTTRRVSLGPGGVLSPIMSLGGQGKRVAAHAAYLIIGA